MMLGARLTLVLNAIGCDRIARVRYEYRLVMHVHNHISLGNTVSATVYALEERGLIVLFPDGRIELTDRGRSELSKREKREGETISVDHS